MLKSKKEKVSSIVKRWYDEDDSIRIKDKKSLKKQNKGVLTNIYTNVNKYINKQ